MQRKVWIDKYFKNWKRTRLRALLLWLFFLLVSVGLGIAFDVDGSVGNVQVRGSRGCTGPAGFAAVHGCG